MNLNQKQVIGLIIFGLSVVLMFGGGLYLASISSEPESPQQFEVSTSDTPKVTDPSTNNTVVATWWRLRRHPLPRERDHTRQAPSLSLSPFIRGGG